MTILDRGPFGAACADSQRLLALQQRLQQMQQVAQGNRGRHEELLRHQQHGRHLLPAVSRILDHCGVLLHRLAEAVNDLRQPISYNHGLAPSRSPEGSVGRSSAARGSSTADDSRPDGQS